MPSLYESTVNTGEVSSSNFTTLYNASGLAVPNAGAGSVTGNLNVGGNLTVQGSSLLIGEVTLQSTLSLPNYTFPLPDGSTFQVLVTDGNGNLYWDDVSAIPGADYSISATTATGGANLTLANTAGFTDSVKFASGTNITVSRTDANTITISTTADDIPNGTAKGQVLYWNGSAWTANNVISSAASADRFTLVYENSSPGTNSALFLRKDYGATNYSEASNDGVGLNYSVTSNSQGLSSYGIVNFEYSATDPQFIVSSSTNNFTTAGTVLSLIDKTTASFYAPDITLNRSQSGSPTLNATITANRGSSTDATLTWNESTDTWDFTNSVVIASDLAVNGGDITTVPGGIANLYNNNAVDTINIGNGVVTEVNIGNQFSGRTQIKSGTIVGANTTQNVFDTVATTVNAFGAATAVNIGASTGVTTIEHDLTVNGGNINLNGQAVAATQPFLTFQTQTSGTNPQYGIRGQSGVDDPWFVGAGSTGADQGYLEIATGDNSGGSNSGGQIYVRQYNGSGGGGVPWYGGTGTVVNEFTLLDNLGNTSIPNNLTVDSGTLFVDATNNRVGVNTITPTNALSVVGNADFSGDVTASQFTVDTAATINTQTTTTTTTSATSISSTTRTTQKVIISITDNVSSEMHVLEALAFMKGTSAYLTTYAEMYSSAALATFTTDVSGGAIRILATPASTNSTTFTVARISVD